MSRGYASVVLLSGLLLATGCPSSNDGDPADAAGQGDAGSDAATADAAITAADAALWDATSGDAGCTGTGLGTIVVLDTDSSGSGMDTNARMIALGDKVVFQGPTQSIWVSDGTPTGTVVLIDDNINLETWTVFGDKLYLIQSGYPWPSYYLWETDGTPGGTSNRGVIAFGGENLDLNGTFLLGGAGELYVEGRTTAEGNELFRFPTPLGALSLALGLTPGADGTEINDPTFYNGKLFVQLFNASVDGFAAYDPGSRTLEFLTVDFGGSIVSPAPHSVFEFGGELYVCDEACVRTDGTQAGTALALVNAGTNELFIVEDDVVGATADAIVFRGAQLDSSLDPVIEHEVFTSNGTWAATSLLVDLNGGGDGNPNELLAGGQHALFLATEAATGEELWITDGTPGGTLMVEEARPGIEKSNVQSKAIIGGKVVFHANDGVHGNELFEYDIDCATTTLVEDKNPGADGLGDPRSLNPKTFVVANDCLFFRGTVLDLGSELCVYCPVLTQ